MRLKQTPSQTVGPFFAYALTPEQYGYRSSALAGRAGRRRDAGRAHPHRRARARRRRASRSPDAMIEIWQADARGPLRASGRPARGSNVRSRGFGRCGTGTDPESRFVFGTIKPGRRRRPGAACQRHRLHARHAQPCLHAHLLRRRGRGQRPRPGAARACEEARRHTLIAARQATAAGTIYRFDIHMQGTTRRCSSTSETARR